MSMDITETDALDQTDMKRLAGGHDAALNDLMERHATAVFRFLCRMLNNEVDANDLAQETFVKALNAIESYRPEFKFSSWIFKIANNAAIDHLRRRELDTLSLDGSPHAETPEAMQATALQIGARQESPLDTVEAKELGGAIEIAIGRLRPEYRSCILLRHVEGRAYEEIAEMLDLPLGTVKTYIHRARNELRHALAHLKEQ